MKTIFFGILFGVVVENRGVYDDSCIELCKVKKWGVEEILIYYIEPCNWQGKGRPKFTVGNILTIIKVGDDDANFPDKLGMIYEGKDMVKGRFGMKFGLETDKNLNCTDTLGTV